MSVLAWLLIAPLGLLVILGLAWFEDRMLRPPASPAEQVLQRQTEADAAPRRRGLPRVNAVNTVEQVAEQVAQGTAELLSLVRLQPRRTAEQPKAQGRDSAV
jgi:ABC-type protease/lipase transport system fused ATPase/permease subunit